MPRRNVFCYALAEYGTRFLDRFQFSIAYEGLDFIPKEGGALLVAKHQSGHDIPFESHALWKAGRYGNWLMKPTLPEGILRLVGGIPIHRMKDLHSIPKPERKAYLEAAKEQNALTSDYILSLFNEGEIVVVHPEGERVFGAMGKVRGEIIELADSARVPIIPLGISYRDAQTYGRVKVYVDRPFTQKPTLEELTYKLSELSDLGGKRYI